MKYIILIGDGMGDDPLSQLAERTPLEAAHTPAMDFIARHGEIYRLATIPEGLAPGSDVANLSLLGYRPAEIYTGRAPLEAASMGIRLAANEIAFRCNLVTLGFEEDGRVIMVDYSAGHISSREAAELISDLNRTLGSARHRFHPGVGYRHLLVHSGDPGSLTTVPPHDHTGRDVGSYWRQYLATPHLAELLAGARRILNNHPVNRGRLRNNQAPANSIWLWGEGRTPSIPTLKALYGISGALISAVDLLKGIGVHAGLEIIDVPGATGDLNTNYAGKAEAALAAVEQHDLVVVHVEAPDEAGHQGIVADKVKAIEDFDRKIVHPLLDRLRHRGEPFRLVVAMDHFTPIAIRTHDRRPVPVVLFDSCHPEERETPLTYTEDQGRRHGLPLADGTVFFQKLLERK